MGHVFSLVLSRVVTNDESVALKGAGCGHATFTTGSLPTNAEVPVTRLEFDDTVSGTLAESIEAALEAVKSVPELTVPGLMVPAQGPAVVAGEVVGEGEVGPEPAPVAESVEAAVPKQSATRKSPVKKPAAKRTTTKKAAPRKVPAKPGVSAS